MFAHAMSSTMPGDGEQHGERRPRLAVHLALAARAGRQRQLLRAEALHRLVAHPGLQRRFDVGDDRRYAPFSATRACSSDTPGLSRPNTYTQYARRLSKPGPWEPDSISPRIVMGTYRLGLRAERRCP